MSESQPANRLEVSAGLLALALLSWSLLSHFSIADDAFISFRYLENWLGGHGLVFNPGERVEGYSNFLWILLLAPLQLVGVNPESGSVLLGLCATVWLLYSVFRTASILGGGQSTGWLAVILMCGSLHLATWAVSGMETVLFAAFIAAANWLMVKDSRIGNRSSVMYGLAMLTRPPGALHAAVALLIAAGRAIVRRTPRWRQVLGPMMVAVVLPLIHLGFRFVYYGDLLPNTAYAKIGGHTADLTRQGIAYLQSFLVSGGSVLVICAFFLFLVRKKWNWLILVLVCQVLAHCAYVVWVGGDYFPYHRFLVPVIPQLAVLGGVALSGIAGRLGNRAVQVVPLIAVLLAGAQAMMGWTSRSERAFAITVESRRERALVADWLRSRFEGEPVLAINAAGIIPYRTGWKTIDMLGLNDRHIARNGRTAPSDGGSFVGHLRHDGEYVCDRAPDLVLTSGAVLFRGRTAAEAKFQAALNTFTGDREFLRAEKCRDLYLPIVEELRPGGFAVVYRRSAPIAGSRAEEMKTASDWHRRGLALMAEARFEEAIDAFEKTLELSPNSITAATNLGYCHLDLGRPSKAAAVFEKVLQKDPRHFDALFGLAMARTKMGDRETAGALWKRYIDQAPDSPWKQEARERLLLLGSP